MADFLLVVIAAFVAAGIVFGIAVLATSSDPGLAPADPDRRPRTLPRDRPLVESDVAAVRFDTGLRGYRMADVDEVLRRVGYDIGYKTELIRVMEAELTALRTGELDQANELRRMRLAALGRADPDAGESEQVAPGVAADDKSGEAASAGAPEADVRREEDGDADVEPPAPEADAGVAAEGPRTAETQVVDGGDEEPADADQPVRKDADTPADEPGEVASRRG